MRDHEPTIIEEFNGLWARGGADSCPLDHFTDCDNIKFIQSGFRTRDGIFPYLPYGNVLQMVTHISQQNGVVTEGEIVLDIAGNFYYSASPTPFTPFLSIVGATGFGYYAYAGRAYITPNKVYTDASGNEEIYGLQNEYLYVYKGSGSARRAGGAAPTGFPSVSVLSPGLVAPGSRVYAFAYETDTGFITAPSGKTEFTIAGTDRKEVRVTGITVGPSNVVARWLMMSQAIKTEDYTGNNDDYELFFVYRIGNNIDTQGDVSITDEQLISSADYLNDLFDFIPAGVNLTSYHGRLISVGEYSNISVARVSEAGQPEAFNQVSGLIVVPLDGRPLTAGQEYRDNLVLFKQVRTYAYNDNGGDPSSWTITVLDQGVGCSPYGVGTVLDSGGVNIEFLIIVDYSGVMLFNGTYARPELSWKVQDYWLSLDRSVFHKMQILNDSINQVLYIILTDGKMLVGNYSNGLHFEKIRWTPWSFDIKAKTIALISTNTLLIGATTASP